MIYVSESLLYICFSLLIGHSLLLSINVKNKPVIVMPAYLIPLCIIFIPLFSYSPIHAVALENAAAFKLRYFEMAKSIILDLPLGQAWLWTLLGSIGLLCIHIIPVFKQDKHMPKISLLIIMLLAIWLGYGSHAASLSTIKGLLIHTVHFLGVILWLGVLFIVAWFSRPPYHWPAFLKWFSPFAISNVLLIIIAGLTLMSLMVTQYVNSWILPYGQMLLLKHLSIVPLLWLALTNGFLYKKYFLKQLSLHSEDSSYLPFKWLRVESILAVIVLIFTAIMGQQAPPHTLTETLQTESPSQLFLWLYPEAYSPDIQFSLHFRLDSILLLIAAALTFYASYTAFKAKNGWTILITSVLFIVFTYLALMFALVAK